MAKIRIIGEQYIKDYSSLTENNQMKDIYPHIDSAQEIYLRQIIGSSLYEHILKEYDNQTLNPDEVILVENYFKPAVMYRTLYLALPFIQFNLRNKGVMMNQDDNANPADFSSFKFLYSELKTRAEYYEDMIKKYLGENCKLYPQYDDSGLIKKNNKHGGLTGLVMY